MDNSERRFKIKKIEQFEQKLNSKKKDMILKTIQVGIVIFGAVYSNIIYINTDNDISKTISLIVACIYSLLTGKSIKEFINLNAEIRGCRRVIKQIDSDMKSSNSINVPVIDAIEEEQSEPIKKVSLYKEPLEEKPRQKVNLRKDN